MNLRDYLNQLSTRDQAHFAWQCGTTIGYLRRRVSDGGTIGAAIAIAIDRVSAGKVQFEDVRPDVDIAHLRATRRRRRAA
jgi:DNA-binding transcriptional regulator YdaS (Cro superfamily)